MGIQRKWRGFCLFFCLLAAPKSYGEAHFAGFLEARMGILGGTALEYVLIPSQDYRVLSRLDWQELAIPYIDLTGRFEAYHFFVQGNFLTAIPSIQSKGIMEDRDWDNPYTTQLAQYSRHDISIDKHYDLSARLGYSFEIGDFRIAPAAGFSWYTRKWTGTDGYGQYASNYIWTADTVKEAFTGPVITYEQSIWFPFISLEAAYILTRRAGFSIAYSLYPYISVETVDGHLVTNAQYYDVMNKGLGHKIALSTRYFFTPRGMLACTLDAAYEWFAMEPGDSFARAIGKTASEYRKDSGSASKAEGSQWSISLGILMRLGSGGY